MEKLKQAADLLVQLLEVPNLIPFKFKKQILFQVDTLVDEVSSFDIYKNNYFIKECF